MKKIFLTLALVTGMIASAQVRIGGTGTAVDANAILELQSTTKGLLFPKVALTSTTAFAPLAAHTAGMTVYNTESVGDVTPGLYTNNGAAWVKLGGSSAAPAYQNIGGGVQTLTAAATISDSTYFVIYTGATPVTLTPPTPVAGKTFTVRTTSTGTASVAGTTVGTNKGRTFVCDGTTWYALIP